MRDRSQDTPKHTPNQPQPTSPAPAAANASECGASTPQAQGGGNRATHGKPRSNSRDNGHNNARRSSRDGGRQTNPDAANNDATPSKVQASPSQRKTPNKSPHNNRNKQPFYPPLVDPMQAKLLIKSNQLCFGKIRIGKRSWKTAWVSSEQFPRDIVLEGLAARNRALDGDLVAVRLSPPSEWLKPQDDDGKEGESELQPTGQVVSILEENHTLIHFGQLKSFRADLNIGPNDRTLLLCPFDQRVPRLIIPIEQAPAEFLRTPESFQTTMFSAKISSWPDDSQHPHATLSERVGLVGDIEDETEAILIANDVEDVPFPASAVESLPDASFVIPEVEYQRRKDFRSARIFSIDPSTARDLDDALSCELLPDGNIEVGVHIADVGYFLRAGSELDAIAQRRATTVYLVQRAIPMLPRVLCENLCSLNPHVDRLAFSVVWVITPQAEVLRTWFGRSIIRSCCKMAYETAQQALEGRFDGVDCSDMIDVSDGHTVEAVVADIKRLHSLASILRKNRFDEGALKLQRVKLGFQLDERGLPVSATEYVTQEANWLVEEFMLLANMSVARRLLQSYEDRSLLRNHAPPKGNMLEDLTTTLAEHGIPISTESAGDLYQSLLAINSEKSLLVQAVVQQLATKPMQQAKYFSTGVLDAGQWGHYALNVPYYTHFTSPIRRFADVLVHRQLDAALIKQQLNNTDPESVDYYRLKSELAQAEEGLPDASDLHQMAEHCNDKKTKSRWAQEASGKLYLCLYLREHPQEADGVVIHVGQKAFAVYVPEYGVEGAVNENDSLPQASACEVNDGVAVLKWNDGSHAPYEVKMFTPVRVRLTAREGSVPLQLRITVLVPS